MSTTAPASRNLVRGHCIGWADACMVSPCWLAALTGGMLGSNGNGLRPLGLEGINQLREIAFGRELVIVDAELLRVAAFGHIEGPKQPVPYCEGRSEIRIAAFLR